MAPYKKSFSCAVTALAEARGFVRQCARDVGFAERDVFDIVIAVGEACTNAILYAATANGFWVACDTNDGALTVRVHDFGAGFLLSGRARCSETLLRKSGGLGISVMRALMDEVVYEVSDPGTTVRLVKQLRRRLGSCATPNYCLVHRD